MQNQIILDKEGYQKLIQKIENLNINLGRILEKMAIIHDQDIEEFKKLNDMKKELKDRLYKEKEKLKHVVIISNIANNEDIADIGDIVKVRTTTFDGEVYEDEYELVASESDYSTEPEKLSINDSPVASAIYKATVGQKVRVLLAKNKTIEVEILEKRKQKKLLLEQ